MLNYIRRLMHVSRLLLESLWAVPLPRSYCDVIVFVLGQPNFYTQYKTNLAMKPIRIICHTMVEENGMVIGELFHYVFFCLVFGS